MFPLPLLPTVSDNLEHMKARRVLAFQNAFMKNALIRALNLIYDVAPRAKPSHQAFRAFMEYIEMVCDMVSLHLQGDEVFFNSLAQNCPGYSPPNNRNTTVVQNDLKTLRGMVRDWKDSRPYHYTHLQGFMAGMEGSMIEVFHTKLAKFTPEALPQSLSDEKLRGLIIENMIWLGSNSDISILLPFCVSHHDPKMSKYWPSVSQDAFKAVPGLVDEHPVLWQFAPFDPINKSAKRCPM